MSVVPLPLPRCSIETTSSSLIVTIPGRQHWFLYVYPFLMLGMWTGVGMLTGGMLLAAFIVPLISLSGGSGINPGDSLEGAIMVFMMGGILLLFIVIWIVLGLYMLYISLWQVTGIERIEVDARAITVRRLFLKGVPAGRSKIYNTEHVKDLRAIAPSAYPMGWWRGLYLYASFDGTIAFDYGARTFRCGAGVDEAEARAIVQTIQERFPQYRTKT